MTSKNSTGMATSGFLVQVAKVTDGEMAAWRRDYPEAFAREIDPDAGVCLAGWLAESGVRADG
jgi:trimethylamine-N-oxide reductase (cytochrome c)